MKRRAIIGAAAAAMLALGGLLLYGYGLVPADASMQFSEWPPSAAAIQSRIGSATAPTPGMREAARRKAFCDLFKGRFRNHDPKIAVGLRFLTPTRIKLMCPARMEPFYIDQIALAVWREATANFGAPIDVDLYDTFIGTTQIKIGQLRPSPGAPEIAHITYDYSTLQALRGPLMPRRVRSSNIKLIEQPALIPGRFSPGRRHVL